ncbi:SWI/SNF and RSC complex subunit Ssr2 [Basidiobolus ranarum]|uniref:SWI/SNF and RSC complex subunit Ssr2 n=1 Tax=Basidiobolus ranarum TaxID=34480 RepID=A0ABR2W8R2_9FUNG
MTLSQKSGGIDFTYYEDVTTLAYFEPIVIPLLNELRTTNPGLELDLSAHELAHLTAKLQQFQEDALGKKVQRQPSYPMRIPAKLFKCANLTPKSALFHILKAAYQYRLVHGWKDWGFENQQKREKLISLIVYLRDVLTRLGLLRSPRILFSDSIDTNVRDELFELALALKASVVTRSSQATHILDTNEESNDEVDEEWFRTLDKKDERVLVHWWYYPDSYDAWVPETPVFAAEPEPAPDHDGAWTVTTRWLRDSYKFNEWMNEEDYEAMRSDSSDSRSAISGMKRSVSVAFNSEDTPVFDNEFKRMRAEDEGIELPDPIPDHPNVSVIDLEQNGPRPGSRSKRNEYEPLPSGDISNISRLVALDRKTITNFTQPKSSAGSPSEHQESTEKNSATGDLQANSSETEKAIEQPNTPVKTLTNDISNTTLHPELNQPARFSGVPIFASWFSEAEVHDIEIKALPEFFDAEDTDTAYQGYRNRLIEIYRQNPSEYLTVAGCRKELGGDVRAIVRIHAFLEQWGIINYLCNPELSSELNAVVTTGRISSSEHSTEKPSECFTDRTLQLRKHIYQPSSDFQALESSHSADSPVINQLDPCADIFEDGPIDGDNKYQCSICDVDCSKLRYSCSRGKKLELCQDCFLDGKFPMNFYSGDFVKIEDALLRQIDDEPWTDQETLLLLEGVEEFKDDWNRIAEVVGTRSREQCVLHFLQLPIEEPFLHTQKSELDVDNLDSLAFCHSENPVMKTVVFLGSVVNPGIGAAAAKAALKSLAQSATEMKQSGREIFAESQSTIDSQSLDASLESTENDSLSVPMETSNPEEFIENNPEPIAAMGTQPFFQKRDLLKASAAAIRSASEKAYALAQYEEREVQRLVNTVLDAQLKKIDLKLQYLEELEKSMDHELVDLEKQRSILENDRLNVKLSISSLADKMGVSDMQTMDYSHHSNQNAPDNAYF